MKHLIYLLAAVSLLLAGCSDSEQFRVNGTIKGKPTMNLRATYYSEGACHSVITAVRNGEFEFYASAAQPAMLEITDYDFRPLGRLYVANGKTYEISIDPADPYAVEASGSEENERWSAFLRSNAEGLRTDANAAVASYVKANPGDVVSTLLMLTEFDASQSAAETDSLMALIAPEAQPSYLSEGYTFMLQRLVTEDATSPVDTLRYYARADTFALFAPGASKASLIALSSPETGRSDSIVEALREISRKHRRLTIIDYSLDADTIAWRNATAADSASWTQAWVPGGLAATGIRSLGVPSLPFFIVCDSTGSQLYRGASISRAEAVADSLLKKR